MAPATKRPPSATLISNAVVEQAALALQALPEKPKENLSLRETVQELQGFIRNALAKGYSYEDVAALLNDLGVSIAPSSLRYYVNQASKGAKSATRSKAAPRAARTKADSLSSSDNVDASAPPADMEPSVIEDAQEDAESAVTPRPAEPSTSTKRSKRSPRSAASTSSKTVAKQKAEPTTKVSEASTAALAPETTSRSRRAKSNVTPAAKTKTKTTAKQRKKA